MKLGSVKVLSSVNATRCCVRVAALFVFRGILYKGTAIPSRDILPQTLARTWRALAFGFLELPERPSAPPSRPARVGGVFAPARYRRARARSGRRPGGTG